MNFRNRVKKLEKSTAQESGIDIMIRAAEATVAARELPEGSPERLRLERIVRLLDPDGIVDMVERRHYEAKKHREENYAIMQKVEWARDSLEEGRGVVE